MPTSPTCPMSGQHGAVSFGGAPLSTIRNWQTTISSELKTYIASNTKGGTGRRPGIMDWTGDFAQYGGYPVALPGDPGLFIGYAGPGSGVPGTIGPCAEGLAMIQQLATTWNWVTDEIVSTTYNMVNIDPGGLIATENTVIDNSSPVLDRSSACAPWEITPVGHALLTPCIEQATLTVTKGLRDYANSCTGGWKARTTGVLDWTLSMVLDEARVANLVGLIPGAFVELACFINATDAWHLLYGVVGDFSNYKVDIETGAIITYTVNISMSIDDGTGTVGSITVPGASTPFWPASGALLEAEEATA